MRCRHEPGSPGERLLSRRIWFDQMVYNVLVERISVRSVHEVLREERASEIRLGKRPGNKQQLGPEGKQLRLRGKSLRKPDMLL